jgi:ABC-type uncharacterized transport system permease subunit
VSPFDVAWLSATIRLATPVLLASTGELVSERAGVLNIGLEGMILSGAFAGFLASYFSHSFLLGLGAAVLAGASLAAVMALVSIKARADQIVTGVGLNIVALGATTFAYREIFSGRPAIELALPQPIALPGLSDIPVIGPSFFRQTALVYVAFLAVGAVWLLLYRTTWGLSIRAAGELPTAADTSGANVDRIRWSCTIFAGAMAGLAGAYLSIGRVGFFTEGMSAGRGFIALAAVIFGGWRPVGVMLACLALGAADAIQLRLQAEPSVPSVLWLVIGLIAAAVVAAKWIRRRREPWSWMMLVVAISFAGIGLGMFVAAPQWRFPPQLWLSLPYVIALVALAGVVRRVRMPTALATPYVRGHEL